MDQYMHTIFNGMNIHLPAILMFTRGTRFWHNAICFFGCWNCWTSCLLSPCWFIFNPHAVHKTLTAPLVVCPKMGHSPKLRPMTAHGSYTSSINRLYPCGYSIGVVTDKRCCLCLPKKITLHPIKSHDISTVAGFHCTLFHQLFIEPSYNQYHQHPMIQGLNSINCKRHSPSFSLVIPLTPTWVFRPVSPT